MKRLGLRSWFLALGALAIVLSLGLVACGSDSKDTAASIEERPGGRAQAPAKDYGRGEHGDQAPSAELRENLRDRREAAADRRAALLDVLREEMSAEDQALFDELRATVKEQRDTLEAGRQDLADTLEELRALTDRYLGVDSDESGQ